jgi:hypothetical protein
MYILLNVIPCDLGNKKKSVWLITKLKNRINQLLKKIWLKCATYKTISLVAN